MKVRVFFSCVTLHKYVFACMRAVVCVSVRANIVVYVFVCV